MLMITIIRIIIITTKIIIIHSITPLGFFLKMMAARYGTMVKLLLGDFTETMMRMTCAHQTLSNYQGSGFGHWWPWSNDVDLCWVPLLFLFRFQTVRQDSAAMVSRCRTAAFLVHSLADGSVPCARFKRCLTHGLSSTWRVYQRREPSVTDTVHLRRSGWWTKFL